MAQKKNKEGMVWLPLKQMWKRKCDHCKKWFYFRTYKRIPRYCSNACKQAAYRKRQAAERAQSGNGVGPEVLK